MQNGGRLKPIGVFGSFFWLPKVYISKKFWGKSFSELRDSNRKNGRYDAPKSFGFLLFFSCLDLQKDFAVKWEV